MITVDLHLHTTFSDGKLSVRQLIDLYGQAGYDAIAVTDHLCFSQNFLGFGAKFLNRTLTEKSWQDYVLTLEKEKNRAWREYRMHVMTGVEYSRNTFNHKRNAHILAVGVSEYIPPQLDETLWMAEARQQGALIVAAHPLKLKDASSQTYYLIENRKELDHLIDVWEVANHRTLWRDMLKMPYSLIATSDFHGPANWAAWRTRIDCEKDPEAIQAHFKNKNSEREFVFIYGKVSEVKTLISRNNGGGFVDSRYSDTGINGGWYPCYT